MTAIQVPGLLFETEDSEALNAHAATREVVLRSTLDARFVLYHHVIRRRVSVDLEAEFPDPISRHIDARWQRAAGFGISSSSTISSLRSSVAPLAARRAGWNGSGKEDPNGKGGDRLEVDPKDLRSLRAAATGLVAALQAYGATPLGDYVGPEGHYQQRNARAAVRAL